jgi:PD-(D/E)XK nuclease superfamily
VNTIDFSSMLGLEAREEEPPPFSLVEFLKHLSASSIGMLYRCPRQFQHRYLRHEKERPGGNLVIGGMFHKTLEWNYAQKIQSFEDRPLAQAIEYLQDAATPMILEEHGGAGEIAWDKGTSLEDARSDAERITAAYYRTVVPRIQPVATEQKFSIDIPGVEVPVIGYVDVQEELRTVDTKTGKQASRRVKPSWQLQGRLYSLATQKPTEYHSISRAKTPTIVTAIESSEMIVPVPSRGQVVEMVRLVNTAADLIRYFLDTFGLDEEWPTWGAIPDWSRNILPCDMCGWRQGCPAWS